MTAADDQSAWATFQALQQLPQPQAIQHDFARGETLDVILDEIAAEPSAPSEQIRRRFRSLSRNRRTKYYERKALERESVRPSYRRGGRDFEVVMLAPRQKDASDAVAMAQLLMLVRGLLSEADFQLLWEIAIGATYAEIAVKLGISITAAKARIFRIRQRVRTNPVGRTIEEAFNPGSSCSVEHESRN